MKLDEMLGFDVTDPKDRHAEILVDEHDEMLAALVALRRQGGLEQKEVAEAMGIDPSGVSRIESGDRDLHLSTLRRYAFAVGAVIRHDVVPFEAVLRRERVACELSTLSAPQGSWTGLDALVGTHALATVTRR